MLQTCDKSGERKRLEEGGQTAVRVECGEPRKLCSHNKQVSAGKNALFPLDNHSSGGHAFSEGTQGREETRKTKKDMTLCMGSPRFQRDKNGAEVLLLSEGRADCCFRKNRRNCAVTFFSNTWNCAIATKFKRNCDLWLEKAI